MFNKVEKGFEKIVGKENILMNEPMKKHTSFKIGGPVDIMLFPKEARHVSEIINICNKEDIPFMTMGNGTNLVVSDKGIRGVVIKLFKNIANYEVNENEISASSGILLSTLSKIAYRNSLSGLEFASGIPGTLGGAVAMNAGAYGGEMKNVVVETQYVKRNGEIKEVSGDEHEFGYRTSIIQKEKAIVVSTKIRLNSKNKENIKEVMDKLDFKRKDKQPLEMPSAGSVFKRPEGYFAGKLIQDSGLRGYKIGGAQVSEKHCGFIVNTGLATAKDVMELIEYIQKTVKSKFNVNLETEVRLIGEK
ncbi:MAG: UDP-N-acetylmuramate dehydrogenase [Clostridiales bacterium]